MTAIHAILASLGTDGDVIPFVAMGAKLRERGHRVTVVTGEPYRAMATEHGLGFEPLLSAEQSRQMFEHLDFWDPLKGAGLAARYGARLIGQNYELLARLARQSNSILVASPAIVAARLVHETLGRPLATVILQPWMLPSYSAPPVMPVRGLTLPPNAPRPFGKLYYRMLDLAGELLMGRELNGLRRKLRLPPVRRVFQWWFSPQLMIGLFPEWYGPAQSDWPPIRLAGFPMYDGCAAYALTPEVLDFCRSGPKPIAFTFGTGMMHGSGLYRKVIEACERLGARGIVLTRHGRQLPARLPRSVKHVEFAPFQLLFPHCAAVVHHGGIGTVAKALAAGVPQLILPIAYDQLDNAIRVKRLGAGEFIRPGRRTVESIADQLRRLISDQYEARCTAISARLRNVDALAIAADWVEQLAICDSQPIEATNLQHFQHRRDSIEIAPRAS